jgi:L1 cell adhesion molecule
MVTQGQSVRLLCEAHGDPKPQITWTKNGMRISEVDPHYFVDETGSLEIFSVDPQDTATYSCTVVNMAGIKEKRLSLFVQSKS